MFHPAIFNSFPGQRSEQHRLTASGTNSMLPPCTAVSEPCRPWGLHQLSAPEMLFSVQYNTSSAVSISPPSLNKHSSSALLYWCSHGALSPTCQLPRPSPLPPTGQYSPCGFIKRFQVIYYPLSFLSNSRTLCHPSALLHLQHLPNNSYRINKLLPPSSLFYLNNLC